MTSGVFAEVVIGISSILRSSHEQYPNLRDNLVHTVLHNSQEVMLGETSTRISFPIGFPSSCMDIHRCICGSFSLVSALKKITLFCDGCL